MSVLDFRWNGILGLMLMAKLILVGRTSQKMDGFSAGSVLLEVPGKWFLCTICLDSGAYTVPHVIWHSYGKPHFLLGQSPINGQFSIAMSKKPEGKIWGRSVHLELFASDLSRPHLRWVLSRTFNLMSWLSVEVLLTVAWHWIGLMYHLLVWPSYGMISPFQIFSKWWIFYRDFKFAEVSAGQ